MRKPFRTGEMQLQHWTAAAAVNPRVSVRSDPDGSRAALNASTFPEERLLMLKRVEREVSAAVSARAGSV